MIRVALADDEALIRSGLRMILEAEGDIRVTGEAANGAEAIDVAVESRPDVIVMDLRMPGIDGIQATGRLRELCPQVKVLVVTTFDLDENVFAALRAGAGGFLIKDSAPEYLVEAVRTLAAGEALLTPSVTRRLIEHYAASSVDSDLAGTIETLTARELDVMRLVARGMTNAEIAAELFLGEGTVKSHITSILAKLDLGNRAQIVVAAYESGLVVAGRSGNSA